MEIPESKNTLTQLIDASHESRPELPRQHLGCSMLGSPCDRALWLSFRWAVIEPFPGRILRLFRRGHMEEITVLQDLKSAGLVVNGEQSRVDFGSHVSGSLDGIIESGVPEAPKAHHVLEIKTHSKKSFDEVAKLGVEKAKFQHFVQMQVYMYGKQIDRALYYAVCKDNDNIYTERVRLDKEVALKYIARGQRIALSDRMPEPISSDPSWYQCRFCNSHEFCHKTKLTKQVNCRTCAHSTATKDSIFTCVRWDSEIPAENQYTGCDSHILHPDLVPWNMEESDKEWSVIYSGVTVGEHGITSRQFLDNQLVIGDKFVQDCLEEGGSFI